MTGATNATGASGAPLVELRHVSKRHGAVLALDDVSMRVDAGRVTCVLGDNGAGKSTLIKIVAGLHRQDAGELRFAGEPVTLASPRDALERVVATVYQDLAVVGLMPVWRNFFLGAERTNRFGALRVREMRDLVRRELAGLGIDLRDVEQPIGTLSGGERQCVAIARAVHFGARVLVLDEPTAALGVKQSGLVLRNILAARDRGLGVVLVTHNPHHAYPVGDRFVVLKRGRVLGDHGKGDLTLPELTGLMAGGAELEQLAHELEAAGGRPDVVARIAQTEAAEVAEETEEGSRADRSR